MISINVQIMFSRLVYMSIKGTRIVFDTIIIELSHSEVRLHVHESLAILDIEKNVWNKMQNILKTWKNVR